MYKDCALHFDLITCFKVTGLVGEKVNSLLTFERITLILGLSD